MICIGPSLCVFLDLPPKRCWPARLAHPTIQIKGQQSVCTLSASCQQTDRRFFMYSLRLLGGVSLQDPSGPVSGRAAQRRHLALLAILAAAWERGATRDKLVACLWPDTDEEAARHLLSNALYTLRRELGDGLLITAGDSVRLDPEAIWSDVGAFQDALSRGAVEEAVAVYEGLFLEGFHADAGREFESWADSERNRLSVLYAEALESLAQQAEDAKDWPRAVGWWQRIVAHDRYNSRVTLRLMQALATGGDRANALQAARDHERLLREDLGIAPPGEVIAYAEKLREEAPSTVAAAGSSPPEPATAPPREPYAQAATTEVDLRGRMRGVLLRRQRAIVAVAFALAIPSSIAIGWLLLRTDTSHISATRIAVLPFAVRGSERIAFLGEGMVDLLTTALDGAGDLQAVDPHAIIALGDDARQTDPARGRAVAERFGAGLYVIGAIVEAGGRLRASASLFDASSRSLATAGAEASGEDEVFTMVDELARQLLAARLDEPGERLTRLGALTTESYPALKAFLQGEHWARGGRYDSAVAAYDRAVTADSTFALAYYRLATNTFYFGARGNVEVLERATRFSGRLPVRDSLLVAAAHAFFVDSSLSDAERTYERVLRLHPDDFDASILLAFARYRFGLERGLPIAEIREKLESALKLNPNHAMGLLTLASIAAMQDRFDDVAELVERALAVQPHGYLSVTPRITLAFLRDDRAAQDSVMADLERADLHQIFLTAGVVALYGDDRAAAIRAARTLTEPSRPRDQQSIGHELIGWLEITRGRWRAAKRALAAADSLNPIRQLRTSYSFAPITPFLPLDTADLRARHARITRWQATGTEDSLKRTYVLGMLQTRLQRPEQALHRAAELDTFAAALSLTGSPGESARARNLSLTVRAQVAMFRQMPEEALRLLDLVEPGAHWYSENTMAARNERWLRAEALHALGRYQEALRWYLPLAGSTLDVEFLAPKHLRIAEIYDQLGDRDKAAHHYRRFIEVWSDCDPELRPLITSAERALERLVAERN